MTIRESWLQCVEAFKELWRRSLKEPVVVCTELVGEPVQLEWIRNQDPHPLRLFNISNEFCLIQAERGTKETKIKFSEKLHNSLSSMHLFIRQEEANDLHKMNKAEKTMVHKR
jgi:hypothetical protein